MTRRLPRSRHLHFGELSHSTGQGEGIVLTASESEERGREGERGGCLNKISDRRIDDIAQEMQQTTIAMAAAAAGWVTMRTGEEEGCRLAGVASRRRMGQ